jgi:hypothetical protein
MSDGWIKVHRKMLDNPVVFKDADHLAVWMYLLLKATHTEYPTMFNGEKIILKAGQLVTGRKKISSDTGVNESKVNRVLNLFKSEHQIEQLTTRHGSIISIVAWDEYQTCEQQNGQQVNNNRTTSEQQVNTIQEQKNKRTKEIYKDVPEEIKDIFMEWVSMRKAMKKPITSEYGVTRALNKLNSLSKNPEKQRELIGYAIYKNWLSFYPIPQDDKIPKPKVEEQPQRIKAEPMPEETRAKMNALGFGNLIGKE